MALPKDKKLLTVAMPAWKMRAIKKLKQKRAINLSQLVENFLTEYFGEDLEKYGDSESKKNPDLFKVNS